MYLSHVLLKCKVGLLLLTNKIVNIDLMMETVNAYHRIVVNVMLLQQPTFTYTLSFIHYTADLTYKSTENRSDHRCMARPNSLSLSGICVYFCLRACVRKCKRTMLSKMV